MIITPHLILGAAIGAKVKHFGWIIVLGLLSHLILDRIPHWDYGKKIEKLSRDKYLKKNLFIVLLKMGIDGMIGLIIVILIIWQKDMINPEYLSFIIVGIFASLFPDILLGASKLFYVYGKFKKISKSYMDFHHKFLHHPKHIKKLAPIALGTEILASIIAILILLL